MSQSTHNNIELYPLYRTLVGQKYVFIDTQSFQALSSPLKTTVGLSVYLYTYKAINLYPLYRTMESLSLYLLTHKAIRLYTLYRAMVALTVRKQSLYSTNYI